MRQAAEAACARCEEISRDRVACDDQLSDCERTKLGVEVAVAGKIRKIIRQELEDSALGYAALHAEEGDKRVLMAVGVSGEWVWRCENGIASAAEMDRQRQREKVEWFCLTNNTLPGDGDSGLFLFSDRFVNARKAGPCSTCLRWIAPGERVRARRELQGGRVSTLRFCHHCCEAMIAFSPSR
jgi:hypothetical protein